MVHRLKLQVILIIRSPLLPGQPGSAGQKYTAKLYAEIHLEPVQKGLMWMLPPGWWAVTPSHHPPVARGGSCCLL